MTLKSGSSWFLQTILYDWQHKMIVLFTGLILWQYINWIMEEESIWLEETALLVKYTLILTLLIEWIPRMNALFRLCIQLIAVTVMLGYFMGYTFVWTKIEHFADLFPNLLDNYMQLTPYIWFVIPALLVYSLMISWMMVKWRIYAVILVSVLFFAIRDSYSLLVLWEQLAIILLAGLFILVIHHFKEIKNKHPQGWETIAEYPTSVVAPVILLISVTIIFGALAPNTKPLLTDPYTLWKASRGETFSTGGKGFSFLFDPVSSSSGYSRSDSNLGGGFEFDYTNVMSVDTSFRSYWKGEVRSSYNGNGWEKTAAENNTPSVLYNAFGTNLFPADPAVDQSKLKTLEVTQTFTILTEQEYPILFGAHAIGKLEAIDGELAPGLPLQWAVKQGELRWDESSRQPFPKLYSLVSQMPIVEEPELRKAPLEIANRNQFQEYLELPSSVPARVRNLALEITKDADNPYDKVKRIESYLRTTFPYTNKPDTTKARSDDFVDSFLFEIKEGYCDYYSTAMAILVRSLDIPSRWVKGYNSGSSLLDEIELNIPFPEELIDVDGAGIYTVRNSDAHSWVEVYFEGFGWIPFEPTSGFVLPSYLEPEALPELPAFDNITLDAEPIENHITTSDVIGYSAAGLSVLLVLAAAGYGVRYGFSSLWSGFRGSPQSAGLNRQILYEFERFLRYSRRKGFSRYEHETVKETFNRWIEKYRFLKEDLDSLYAVFEKAKYGKDELGQDDVQLAAETTAKLRQGLK